jgi:hypothetical protein
MLIDGQAVFGFATNLRMEPRPNSQQLTEFFGVNGVQTIFGGARGRLFFISGVLAADVVADLNTAEGLLLSFADGLPHIITDNRGRVWPNVIFRGQYQPFDQGPRYLAGGGVCLPYKCVMFGLT